MWDKCDVIITTNERIVKNKPEGKKVILIKTKDNGHLCGYCDLVYSEFADLLTDPTFFNAISKERKTNWVGKMKNKLYKIFK